MVTSKLTSAAGTFSTQIFSTAVRWSFSVPITWAVVALIATGAIIRGTLSAANSRRIDTLLGTGLDAVVTHHNWIAASTSVFFVEKPFYLTAVILATIVLLGAAERLMGSPRTVVVFAAVAIIGIGAGTLIQGLGIVLDSIAAEQTRFQRTMDPIIPVVGTMMAATAYLRHVISRRIRVVGFAALLVFVLYSGQPSDLYRLLAAIGGLLIGFLLVKKAPKSPVNWSSIADIRTLLGSVVAITAIGPVISAMAPSHVGLLEPLGALVRDATSQPSPAGACDVIVASNCAATTAGADSAAALLVTLLPLLLQLIAAFGILRGQRLGLWLAIGINTALGVLAAVYYGTSPAIASLGAPSTQAGAYEDVLLSIVVAVGVPMTIAGVSACCLRFFRTDSSRHGVRRFVISVVAVFTVLCGIYLLSAAASPGSGVRPTFLDLLAGLPERFVPGGFLAFEQIAFTPETGFNRFLSDWLGAAFWFAVVVMAVVGLARPHSETAVLAPRSVKQFLRQGLGAGPLSWMVTWEGHQYWYSADGRSLIGYRVVNGIAIVTGQPVCELEETKKVIEQFVTFCTNRGWTPVFYGVSETFVPLFAEMFWSSMKIAEETILNPSTWSITGKKMQNVRTAITKAKRLGLHCEWTTYCELSLRMKSQVNEISEQWVIDRKLPEMGFTLGGVRELIDPEVALMIATGPDGRIEGITSWLPTFRDGIVVGWTLDFMRRRPDSTNGVMDVIIAETMIHAQNHGIETISLSAAPLAESSTAATVFTGTALLSRVLEPVYGFQSLHQYKKKFQPELRSMYLMYADPFTLPAIGIGLAKAYVPNLSIIQSLGYLRRTR